MGNFWHLIWRKKYTWQKYRSDKYQAWVGPAKYLEANAYICLVSNLGISAKKLFLILNSWDQGRCSQKMLKVEENINLLKEEATWLGLSEPGEVNSGNSFIAQQPVVVCTILIIFIICPLVICIITTIIRIDISHCHQHYHHHRWGLWMMLMIIVLMMIILMVMMTMIII